MSSRVDQFRRPGFRRGTTKQRLPDELCNAALEYRDIVPQCMTSDGFRIPGNRFEMIQRSNQCLRCRLVKESPIETFDDSFGRAPSGIRGDGTSCCIDLKCSDAEVLLSWKDKRTAAASVLDNDFV